MKKALALLVLSLATLPSLALSTRRVEYGGYRIGDSAVLTNETRVSGGLPFTVTDASQDPGKSLSATQVNGQKIVRWWSYGSITQVPATQTVPAHIQYNNVVTNFLAVYSPTWSYNTVSYTPAYLVVDYDYITYTLSYNANGGSETAPSSKNNIVYTNSVELATNTFTRTGYTWAGWTNSLTSAVWTGGDKVTGSSLGLNSIVDGSNVVLRAKWTTNTYTVTLNANGGTNGTASATATYDAAMPTATMPTRTGYTFKGYYDTSASSGGTQYYTASGTSARTWNKASNATLYARWTANKYTVTLNQQNGSGGTSSVTATYAAALPSVTVPTRTGYTFGGYYDQANGGGTQYYTAAGASARNWNKTAATTLYAHWTANTYAVQFNVNGGTGTMSNQSFTYDVAQALTSNAFTRTGYRFVGWATNATSAAIYENKASVSNLTATANATVNLYAKWTANTYTVTLDPGEGTVDPTSVTVTYQGAWPILPEPTREGYYFNGWFNDSAFQTVTPTNTAVSLTSDTTIYAKWTQRLTATFVDPLNSTTQTVDVASGSTPVAPFTPSYNGYTFTGWSPALGNITQDTTYTAQFTGTQYFITYHSNFGIPEKTKEIDYTYGTAKAAPDGATQFPRAGYTFQGWATSAESTAVRFRAGEDIITFSDEGSDLYAVWVPIGYVIEFDGEGAEEGSVDSIAAEYDTVYSLPGNGFVKPGFDFKGWRFGNATYAVGASVSNLTTTANATVTFYAVWSEPRYIAFDGNGANDADAMGDDIMIFEGVETKTLVSNKFEKTGYTFRGWATNETEAAAQTVAYTDGADVASTNLWSGVGETNVFSAVWLTNTYTVVFNANDGTGEMAPQAFVYDQPLPLSKCTFSSNLKFSGWATNQTGDVVFDDEAIVSNLTAEASGTVTLYAVWDNGDLSKAMHCRNLVWVQKKTGAEWTIVKGADEGYNPSGSSVASSVSWNGSTRSQTLATREGTTGSGTLSFWYKATRTGIDPYWFYFKSGTETQKLVLQTTWTKFGPVDVAELSTVAIYLTLNTEEGDDCTVWIDQMTWVPAGSTVEPTEEDVPAIAAFAATTGGFTLSVDPANISDSFSYQILATNELVGGDWPVMTNLTSDVIGSGFTIVPEADAPTMFYKVKVIAK